MDESVRALLYPLGFLASLFFSIRFFMQWIVSEKRKESLVTTSFWKCSLIGNLLMVIHTFIQIQYPFCMIQTCNAVISWRNLNLMKPKEEQQTLATTLLILFCSLILITYLFSFNSANWIDPSFSFSWHLLGFIGGTLFAMRFWIQWLISEKKGTSVLGKSFWWFSLIGGSIALIYFIRLMDLVNILGYGLGLIPYLRNLMLMKKKRQVQ